MLELHQSSPEYYSQLNRDILLQLRGSMSQNELSTKLGYSFNQVGKWESGVTQFHWQDFIHLNEVLRIPWQAHFEAVFSFHSGMKVESAPVFEILSHFFGHASVREMALRLHKSRSSVSRLLHSQVKIDFTDILRVMDQRSLVLTSWLSKFLNPQNLPSMQNRFQTEVHLVKGLLSVPWAPIVNSCLHLKQYKGLKEHSSSWVAEKTGLTEDDVQFALQKLIETGIVEYKNLKYTSFVLEMTFLRVPEFRQVTRFLSELAARSFQTKSQLNPNFDNPSLSSSRVYPLSSEAAKKVSDALVLFHHELSEILKNDKAEKDHVRAILIHSLDLEIVSQVALSRVSQNGTA